MKLTKTQIGKQYTEAHATQYGEKDLRGALALYAAIISADPDSQEAGYARSQVKNMVNSVISMPDLFDAHAALLTASFDDEGEADAP